TFCREAKRQCCGSNARKRSLSKSSSGKASNRCFEGVTWILIDTINVVLKIPATNRIACLFELFAYTLLDSGLERQADDSCGNSTSPKTPQKASRQSLRLRRLRPCPWKASA